MTKPQAMANRVFLDGITATEAYSESGAFLLRQPLASLLIQTSFVY